MLNGPLEIIGPQNFEGSVQPHGLHPLGLGPARKVRGV